MVLWTASVRRLAYAVTDALDHHKPRFHHVLTRSDTTLVLSDKKTGKFFEASVSNAGGSKSLERLNREMKDILFIDDNGYYDPNLIIAPKQILSPQKTDYWLQKMLPTILTIAGSEVKDVREYLMKHNLNEHFDPKLHLEPEYSSNDTIRPLTQSEMDAYIAANPEKWQSLTFCFFDPPLTRSVTAEGIKSWDASS